MAYRTKSYYQDRDYKVARPCSYLRNDDKNPKGETIGGARTDIRGASSLRAMPEVDAAEDERPSPCRFRTGRAMRWRRHGSLLSDRGASTTVS
ncbi:hypothetical protein TM239_45140 [Bradyrhizobium sp. TM239]|nr:hypothetical protein TM239_45140 [Bradyrhizobium sp. TM239]